MRFKRLLFAGVVAGVVLGVAACTTPVPASTTGTTGISVTGTGEASGSPDVAFVEMGVDARSEEIEDAVEQANTAVADITAALVDLGVDEEDIQTSNFNVFQDERFDDEGQVSQRIFRVQNTLRVRVTAIDMVGEVLDAGLSNGANQIYGLSFGIDDPQSLQDEARIDAIRDARRKAEMIAEELGVELGDPIYVSDGNFVSPSPIPVRLQGTAVDEAFAGGAPPISEGQLQVTSSVSVIFEIR